MKWLGLYRPVMRVAHHFNWHHARILGPLQPPREDGRDYQRWCEWCGWREAFNPNPPKVLLEERDDGEN